MNVEEKKIKIVEDEDSGLKLSYTSGESDPYKLTSKYLNYSFRFSLSDLQILKKIIDVMLESE